MTLVKTKLLREKSKVPFKKLDTDFAYDLTANSRKFVKTKFGWQVHYGLGFQTQITTNQGMKIAPRSSISKTRLRLVNPEGIIDCSYRGEWIVIFDIIGNLSKTDLKKIEENKNIEGIYDINDRIAQTYILDRKDIDFKIVEQLDDSERGTGGFGSTGK